MRDATTRPRFVRLFLATCGVGLALMSVSGSTTESQAAHLGAAPLEEVIAALTREEKVKLLRGVGMKLPASLSQEVGPAVGLSLQERVPGAAGSTYPVPRLGIPSIVMADGPAGLRIEPRREGSDRDYYATAFPIATLLASTWDVELVEQVGKAMGHEVKEYGVDVLLAPAMNLHRFPLGGRNFEYYSEDPLVSGKMAAAMVRGVQSQGVGTSIKHYAANNHEWNRLSIDVNVDQRALREIYLRGFETAIKEGQPWTVMSSYNKVNGEYTSESRYLLTEILRAQWRFQGLVTTDWFAGLDAAGQVRAGNDLLMPGTDAQEHAIHLALDEGALDEASVDRNLANLLRLIMKTPSFAGYDYSEAPDLASSAELARIAAAEGMVLLKNDKAVLPIEAGTRVAVFGNYAHDLITGGTGSGDVNEAYVVSMREGLEGAGLSVDAELAASYLAYLEAEKAKRPKPEGLAAFMPQGLIPELELSAESIDELARANSAALVVIARNSGEFADREAAGDFYLSDSEQTLLEATSSAFHVRGKPVVAILNTGGVVETASWRDKVDAIVLVWQPGQEAGNAIADVLIGRVNPSGKLVDSFPILLEDLPAAENFPGVLTGENPDPGLVLPTPPAEIEYKDSIWVGYRCLNSHDKEVAYPFGYGLSYTRFSYEGLALSGEVFDEQLTVSLRVTNIGRVAGREAVQLYIGAPDDGMEKPSEELRAFSKTRLLAPGETQRLTFALNARDLASYDVVNNAWVADAGEYRVRIGASSRDIRAEASFRKPSETLLSP